MIDVSAETIGILSGSSWVAKLRVESWLGDELLDDDVPVNAGREEGDRSLSVPERVTLSVPRLARGVSYSPIADDSALAANGQRLRILYGVGGRGDEVEWLQRGWFVVQDSETRGDTVEVSATGLLTLIDEARLVSPYQPTGTLGSTLRSLLEPALTVDLTAAPTDRSVPTTVNFDEDRLQAVYDLLDAWSAMGRVDANGVFVVTPATQSTSPSVWISPQTTKIRATGGSTRDGVANVIVARGTAADGGQVQGTAYDRSTGPKAYGGNFNPLPVPFFYSSPLLTTVAQCSSAAATILARRRRESSQAYDVEMVPDPRLQLGDVAELEGDEFTAPACSIEQFSLPLLPGDGSMTLSVRKLT